MPARAIAATTTQKHVYPDPTKRVSGNRMPRLIRTRKPRTHDGAIFEMTIVLGSIPDVILAGVRKAQNKYL